jgi:ADP-ribose pyrophosphatase YjhB (NUDIX family)
MEHKLKPGKDYIGVGGGVLIFNKKGEVLLKKRSKKSRNEIGKWEKPGGGIDFGECSIKAMRREIKEETDIDINIWGLLPHTDHILKKEKQHWLALNYLAKIKSGIAKNTEPDKCDELKWFLLDKLPKKLANPTKESIKNYLKGKYIKLK